VALRSEDLKLIIRVINFELVQPICPQYINVTDGQTDGRTTYDTALTLCAYVHCVVINSITCSKDISLLAQCCLPTFEYHSCKLRIIYRKLVVLSDNGD